LLKIAVKYPTIAKIGHKSAEDGELESPPDFGVAATKEAVVNYEMLDVLPAEAVGIMPKMYLSLFYHKLALKRVDCQKKAPI